MGLRFSNDRGLVHNTVFVYLRLQLGALLGDRLASSNACDCSSVGTHGSSSSSDSSCADGTNDSPGGQCGSTGQKTRVLKRPFLLYSNSQNSGLMVRGINKRHTGPSRKRVLCFERATIFHNRSEDCAHIDVLDQSVIEKQVETN
ncbi:hypothetical protein Ccrd_013311 [Cynara cardunculus var. scolymus]|uniref:Uncharacterized protein n=1 Tax=Cynara cardunculus var. scolymus TaxID=59895 RepID=A0A103YFU9_CYNCS|nr:hypothetical protein Ccrd_013311 [Cynara cardunculus var. scolymus]